MAKKELSEIEINEHIDDQDGENIHAKRAGIYGYDTSGTQWRRIRINASGQLI